MTNAAPVVVIGVGNPDRGDDVAGREVVRRLRSALPHIEAIEHDGEAASLLAHIEGAGAVYLIDACVSGAAPGAVHCFDAGQASLPSHRSGFSSHGFGLAAAIELARTLGVLPRDCFVYAIEGAQFDVGAPMSDAVATAVDELTCALVLQLSAR